MVLAGAWLYPGFLALACVVNPIFFADSIREPPHALGDDVGSEVDGGLDDRCDQRVGAALADALGRPGVSRVAGVLGHGGEHGNQVVVDHDHGVVSPSGVGPDASGPGQAAGGVARVGVLRVLGYGANQPAEAAFAGGGAARLCEVEALGQLAAGGALLGRQVEGETRRAAGVSVGHGFLLRAV